MVLIGRMRYKLFLLGKEKMREKFLKWLLFFPQLKSALQKTFKYLHQKKLMHSVPNLNRILHFFFQELTEPTVIEQGAYILIAAGAFIFIISFLGYCGAIKESRVLLTAYGLFIIIIALLQIAAIVLAILYRSDAEDQTQKFFLHTIRKYYTHKSQRDAVTLSWDFMMAEVCTVDFKSVGIL